MIAAGPVAGTIVGLHPLGLAIAIAIVMLGAAVQGSIGFGLGLLAAPVLGIIDPDFLPVTVVAAVVPLGFGVVLHDHVHIVWREVAFAIAGRVPGVLIGTWLVHRLGTRAISVVIAVSVLLAVIGSVSTFRFRPTHRNLVVAGFASGVTGTASGIGGPPMALTYQHADPTALRATLSGYFAIGAMLSFLALLAGGEVGRRQMELTGLLLPAVLVGLAMSRIVIRFLPAARLRPVILTVCSLSAVALLVETFA